MLSVKELFAKQLVQLSGLSAEKAKSITEKYTTPSRFVVLVHNIHIHGILIQATLRSFCSELTKMVLG